MFPATQYELLDFGDGRRLERFGALVLDRPAAAATVPRRAPDLWRACDARFEESRDAARTALGTRGVWRAFSPSGKRYFVSSGDVSSSSFWPIGHEAPKFVMALKGSPFGHIGVFPEQSENWQRIASWCTEFATRWKRPARVLNLFAYTGGMTLAAAAAGASVTHVDAAKNIVQAARKNAELSFGTDGAVRWIADDAMKYVYRELKRERRYDGVVLDPPTYGHGARGEVWRFSRDAPRLIAGCARLLDTSVDTFMLATCHVTGLDAPGLRALVVDALRELEMPKSRIESSDVALYTGDGGTLPAGERAFLRFEPATR